jgi:hypothetical protein
MLFLCLVRIRIHNKDPDTVALAKNFCKKITLTSKYYTHSDSINKNVFITNAYVGTCSHLGTVPVCSGVPDLEQIRKILGLPDPDP